MTKKDPRSKGFSWMTPILTVKNMDRSIEFYQNAFGFKLQDAPTNENGVVEHAELVYKDQVIMLSLEGSYGSESKSPKTSQTSSPISLYVYVDDVDQFFNSAKNQGAGVKISPEDTHWGDRMCVLIDPDDYGWCFATHKEAK